LPGNARSGSILHGNFNRPSRLIILLDGDESILETAATGNQGGLRGGAGPLTPAGSARSGRASHSLTEGLVMSLELPCPHCNGTTFCGGFRRKGMLMMQPACAACVARSGLSPERTHHRVPCSACGGKGVVPPSTGSARLLRTLVRWLVALSLLLISLALGIGSVVFLQRDLHRDEAVREGVHKMLESRRRKMSVVELKANLPAGSPTEDVMAFLGDPDRKHVVESGLVNLEVWYYTCADGQVLVTIRDDKVIAVNQ
jgi:hypothetical protein